MKRMLFLLLLAACLLPIASPGLALAAGGVLALTCGNPFAAASRTSARFLLQSCVILLGFGIDLPTLLRVGREGALLAAATIALTFALGFLLGRWLKLGPMISLLVSAGTAICGGSAIAAVGSITRAKSAEITVAMATVFLLNALALYTFPTLGHALHLSDQQFGAWAGIAIHDISSVVGAAARYSAPALQTAAAVKLSRALWIVPVALAAAAFTRTKPVGLADTTVGFDAEQTPPATRGKLQIPWFIALFLLASILRSASPAIAAHTGGIAHFATVGLTVTLFLVGAGLSRDTLMAVGWKPLLQGAVLWVAVSVAALAAVICTMR
jgi:uncharacterized integral membrane protein (TIGR00698 family)